MMYLRRSRFFRTVVLPLTLVALLPACYKWSSVDGPPYQAFTDGRPKQTRVTVNDGSQVTMQWPRIQGDSILGLSEQGATLAVRLSDVSKLEKRKFDWTPIVVGLVLVTVLGIVVCAAQEEDAAINYCE